MISGLAALILLLVAALGLSAWMLRPDPEIPWAEYMVLRFSLGLGLISLITLGAGFLGGYHPAWFWTVAVAGSLMLWRFRRDFAIKVGRLTWSWPLGVLAGFFLLNLFYALFPPTFHDSMVYHLAVPAHYIRHGAMVPWLTNFNASLPLPVEMIYTTLLLGKGLYAVRLLVLVTASGLAVLLFHQAGGMTLRRRWLPLLLFFTIPQVGFLAGSSKTDIPGLLFLMTGITLLRHHMRQPGKPRLLILAAFAMGTAAAAKYTAFFFVIPALAAAWIMAPRIRRGAGKWAMSLLAGAVCLVPWWSRNLVFTGNPVYPYFNQVFQAPQWSPQQARDFSNLIKRRQGNEWHRLVTFPVAIFLKPYHYGMTAVWGILFLIFLPGIFVLPRIRGERLLWFAGLSGFVVLLFFARAPRYFLPALCLLAVPAARGMGRILKRFKPLRTPALLGLGLCLATNWVLQADLQERYFLGARHLTRRLQNKPVSAYLDMLPYHRAARFAKQNLENSSRVAFLGEDRSFYFPGDNLVSSVHDINPVISAVRNTESLRAMQVNLARLGITHILYCPHGLKVMGKKSVTHRLSPGQQDRWESFLGSLTELYRDRRYRLLALPRPASESSRTKRPKSLPAG